MNYSGLAILWQGLNGNRGWAPVWRNPEPKPLYDVLIIGGGGTGWRQHSTLPKNTGITNVAVLEKG